VWQQLFEGLKTRKFMVVAVAEESRGAEHARPWIEQAKAEHWSLIDSEHRVSALYGMVNVPQAVWIDEEGRIVRPPETAGSTDHFRRMDRATRKMTPEDQAARLAARATYLDAVKDWVLTGRYELPPDQVRQRLPQATAEIARASAHFRLGIWLQRSGRAQEAAAHLAEASRLHPDSWAIWRQAAELQAAGGASGEAFWQRVDALGERPYYPEPEFPAAR
jgi:hypothetical protein